MTSVLFDVLLRRQRALALPAGDATADLSEIDERLLALGYALGLDARESFAALPADERTAYANAMLQVLTEEAGAHVTHVPLTGREDTRVDPDKRERALTRAERVRKWIDENADADELAISDVLPDAERPRHVGQVRILRRVDGESAGQMYLTQLLTQPGAPSDTAKGDIRVLIGALSDPQLPRRITSRESMAVAVAALVARGEDLPALLAARTRNPTDVLRVIATVQGGDPSLRRAPSGRRSLPRATRRALLERLESFDVDALCEAMTRRPETLKRLIRPLHPMEKFAQRPKSTLAFSILHRQAVTFDAVSGLPAGTLAQVLSDAARLTPGADITHDGELIYRTWASRFEQAIADENASALLTLFTTRPGEILRRADHVLRVLQDTGELTGRTNALVYLFNEAAQRANSALLLSVAAHLRYRTEKRDRRLAQTASGVGYGSEDTRDALPSAIVEQLVSPLEDELLARAAARGPLDGVRLDTAMATVPAPLSARDASGAMVTLPRGATLPFDENAGTLRLFVHWMEARARNWGVDLDLSVAMLGADGTHLGHCDYTCLSVMGGAAQHSGDLTSAPPPHGSTEYIDLDLAALRAQGVEQLATVCFAYSDTPFDELAEAFCGLMIDPQAAGFRPEAVTHRTDLTGDSRALMPLLINITDNTVRAMDLNLRDSGIHAIGPMLEQVLVSVGDVAAQADARPTLASVTLLHAAARAKRVDICAPDGTVTRYTRTTSDTPRSFLARLRAGEGGRAVAGQATGEWLAVVIENTAGLPENTPVCVLGDTVIGEGLIALAPADLVGALERA